MSSTNGMAIGALTVREKETGLNEILAGMSLKDFHAPVYLSTGNEICQDVKGGETVSVPSISILNDRRRLWR